MGSLNPPPELTLDINPTFIPNTITQFLRQLSTLTTLSDKILKLDDFLTRLETEMQKIHAFKRELPLCMLLINDAIVALKDELMVFKKTSNCELVLEEFIPIKKSCDEDHEQVENKKNWLSSTQLWNANDDNPNNDRIVDQTTKKVCIKGLEDDEVMINDSYEALVPFRGRYGLSLITPGNKKPVRGSILLTKASHDSKLIPFLPNDQSNSRNGPPSHQQASRKQRRCWSTELHKQFVNALQELGGSQVATPKQIRELMQVDGLTNDEVKSHLQKYRLHTRRLPSSNTSFLNQCLDSSKHGISHSGSPDGPLLIGTATGGTSTTGGDSMDDGDDSKSENYCWKGV
ncbi:myb family transcription factor EFM-like [Bidens hawaiensis]|uniref:myb family transcription factor EFM-like n=1 Tax=Bidens hawaiensis TaxID=980011 RepID=UPI00404B76E2